jgi:hypothetical protein
MKNLTAIYEFYVSLAQYSLLKRIGRRAISFLLGAFIMTSAGSSTSAQPGLSLVHPNLAPGSGSDKTMERYPWDCVNLFNGNLNISLMLGIKYPLAGDFGYQFSLTYNSTVWDFEQPANVVAATPVRNANAGFGWDLSFGRLIPPATNGTQVGRWVYVSPDGALHPLYSTLHYDLSENDPDDVTGYTRDGSYYRMKVIAADQIFIEAPDGAQSLFKIINGEWKLAQIGDRFNSRLWFTYSTPNAWVITDNHGRTQTIHFRADPAAAYPYIVDRIVLAGFNATTATYTFSYTTASVPRPAIDSDPATSASVNVPLLSSITHPDNSKHTFTYHPAGAAADSSGRLASMQLPTLGKIAWTYQNYSYTSGGYPTTLPTMLRRTTGVASRSLLDMNGTVTGTWTYTPSLRPSVTEERELLNTVKTPMGDKTIRYFSVNTQATGVGWNRSDYGLPLTKNQPDNTGSRYLSSQVFDCDAAGNNCQLVRSKYVRYEQDTTTDPASPEVESVNRREASYRNVYHDDVHAGGAERFADINRSDFDGLGHYRRTTTNGDFGSGDVREDCIEYDASTGTYPSVGFVMPSPATSWITNLVKKRTVIEGQARLVTEYCFDRNNGFLKRERRWASTSLSGGAGATDLLISYVQEVSGQAAIEQYFGGDVQPIGTGSLCSLAIPSTDQYQIRHAYSNGVRSSSRYHTASGAQFGPKFLDQDIDGDTGLVSASRDGAGIRTSYEYDALGRQTWKKPEAGHGAWKQFNYTLATPTEQAKKFIYDKTNGTGNVLTYNAEVYDSFGQVWWEQTAFPGSYPSRYTFRNAMGWITHKTGYSLDAPKYTEFYDYDPFGRPRLVRPPQGSQHDMTFQYKGVGSITTTLKVATSYNTSTGAITEEPRATTEVYDRQGRLWKKISHLVDQFGVQRDAVTTNTYDVQDRLVSISKDGRQISGSSTYDGRGFLRTEVFTESGGQTVNHLDIDAFGIARRAQRQNNGEPTVVSVAYSFDRAGRLTKVSDYNDPSKVLKEYFYADANEANNWKAGKLWKAVRYNDMTRFLSPYGISVVAVTETYSYGGAGGRVSEYVTELSDSSGRYEKFIQSQSYTELGEVANIGYPKAASNSSVTINRDRTVANSYSVGQLTSISGTYNSQAENWASAISYHANGMVNQITRANGVTDSFGRDPDNHLRPSSISTSGARHQPSNVPYDMNINPYIYDGGGNLAKAGDRYLVRPNTYQEPTPSEPVTYSTDPCTVGWRDQLGLVTALNDHECRSRVFHFYTASDRLYKIENPERGEAGRTWYLYDAQGTLLTEHKTAFAYYQVWPSIWEYTRDYIYSGRGLLATDEINRNYPKQILHYHGGAGVQGIKTDGQGYRR